MRPAGIPCALLAKLRLERCDECLGPKGVRRGDRSRRSSGAGPSGQSIQGDDPARAVVSGRHGHHRRFDLMFVDKDADGVGRARTSPPTWMCRESRCPAPMAHGAPSDSPTRPTYATTCAATSGTSSLIHASARASQSNKDGAIPMSVLGASRHAGRVGIRSLGAAVVLSSLAAVTAGCGSGAPSSTSSSPSAASSSPSAATSSSKSATSGSISYPAGKEDICQARDQLRTSITDLTNTQVVAGGTNAIKAAVGQVQTALDEVKAAAKDDYQAQVTAVQTALQDLQAAVANLGSGDTTDNLRAVSQAITTTGAAAETLFTQLKTACGS